MLKVKNYSEFLDSVHSALSTRNKQTFLIDDIGDIFNAELTQQTWVPEELRSTIIESFPRNRLNFLNLFRVIPSSQSKLVSMRQTERSFTTTDIVVPETSGGNTVAIAKNGTLTFAGDVPEFVSRDDLGTFSTLYIDGTGYKIVSVTGANDAAQVVKVAAITTAVAASNYSIQSELHKVQPRAYGARAGTPQFAYTPESVPHISIPAVIPVHQETFEDTPLLRGLINTELTSIVVESFQEQVLAGNGTAPNMRGLINYDGIKEYTRSEQFYTGATNLLSDFRQELETSKIGPLNGILFNANMIKQANESIENEDLPLGLLRYEGGVLRAYGYPVRFTNAFPDSLMAIAGNFNKAVVAYRQQATIDVAASNRDEFEEMIVSVRINLRGVLGVQRIEAFAKQPYGSPS